MTRSQVDRILKKICSFLYIFGCAPNMFFSSGETKLKIKPDHSLKKASNVKILNSLLDFLWNIFAETSEGRCSNPACACSGPHAVCAEHVAAAVRSLFMQIKPTAAE